MKENALHNILKSILSLSLNAQGRANQSTNVMYKRGQDLVPARLEGKKNSQKFIYKIILLQCYKNLRTMPGPSMSEPNLQGRMSQQKRILQVNVMTPFLVMVFRIWIHFLHSTTYIRNIHL